MKTITKNSVAVGIICTLVFMAIAMLQYPGGTYLDVTTVGYDWTQNFISNLFKEKALNGAENSAQYWAFAGMFFYAFTCALFFIHTAKKIPNSTAANFVKYTGILTMPCILMVATPFHDLMLAVSNYLFWACIIAITVYLLKSKSYLLAFYALLCILIFYYATYLYIAQSWETLVIVQKVNNLSAIILIFSIEYFTTKESFLIAVKK